MSAHPQLPQTDAEVMVSYILSLGEKKKTASSLPVKGSYTMNLPKGDKGEGRYLIRAAYTDKGYQGVPPIMAEKTLLLRSAKVPAGKADKTDGVMKYGTIIIASVKGSNIGFSNIDLTGIEQIKFTASAPKAQLNAAGGIIEVRLDEPTGKLVGQTALITPGDGASVTNMPPPVVAKLSGAIGVHDVYLVFKNDKAPAGHALFVIMDLEFQTGQATNNSNPSATQAAPSSKLSAQELDAYTGKYKMSGLPFEYIEITAKDGHLYMKAGTNEGELTPGSETDEFKGGSGSVFKFGRDADKKVTSIALQVQGMTFKGTK
jgi:cytochrome c